VIAELAGKYWWARHFARGARPWDELDNFPQRSPEEQRRQLAVRLLEQIQYFGGREDALPEWREAARISDPNELWRIWPALPVVTKKTLRERFPPEEVRRLCGLEGISNSTGGSTGEPTHFFQDREMGRAAAGLISYAWLKMGWRPGMATIVVWGSERDIGKLMSARSRLNYRLLRIFLVDGYALDRSTVSRVLDIMRRQRRVAIYGFTSMLEFVAGETLAMGLEPPPGTVRAAWNGGEMLFPDQVELFREAFGAPILNSYGGRELSTIATQLEAGGPLHVFRPWLFLEVVREDGAPAGPGEIGRLLCTSTITRGTPFLRYEVGDLGAFDAGHQTEAGVSALRELHGRIGSVVRLPSGKVISNLFWNHFFKECPEVRQFQVRLAGDGTVRCLLRGAGFSPEREGELRAVLQNFLGPAPVEFSWVERIPLTSQGKLIQVMQEPAGGR
jgi:phenylacetate-CoA ligase